MSHAGGDAGECNSAMHAWNRTPGKPNLTGTSSNLDSSSPWGGNNKIVSSSRFSGDSGSLEDVWSNLTDCSSRKLDNEALWPTPAEVAGGPRHDADDFSWNAAPAGATLALRSALGCSDERTQNSAWPSLDTAQQPNSDIPRAIIGQQPGNSGPTADATQSFESGEGNGVQGQHLPGVSNKRKTSSRTSEQGDCHNFPSWGSPVDGEFNVFPSPSLPSTDNATVCKQPDNRSLSGDCSALNATACSSISDSANHTDGTCENDEIVSVLVNSKECWGQRPVDQSTPWDVSILASEESTICGSSATTASASASTFGQSQVSGLLGDAVSVALQQQRRIKGGLAKQPSGILSAGSFESNVWPSEPPNGTGIWESHYESLGERTARRKQPSAVSPSTITSSPGLSRLTQPGCGGPSSSSGPIIPTGRTPLLPPSSASPGGILPSYGASTGGNASPSFMSPGQRPAAGGMFGYPGYLQQQQPQGRFGPPFQSAAGRTGIAGPNGMLGMPSGFRPGGGAPMPANWPISISDGSGTRLDDISKNLGNNGGSWPENASHGRPIGKQIPNTQWPSPISELGSVTSSSGWPTSDPRKLTGAPGPWNHLNFSSGIMPHMNPQQQQQQQPPPSFLLPRMDSAPAGPRFHPTAQHPPQLSRHQLPQRQPGIGNANQLALLRPSVVRHLFNLGFTEEAKSLLTDSGIDLERLLIDLRHRTGHPGLAQLTMLVSSVLSGSMSPSEIGFEGAGAGGSGSFFDHPTPSARDQILRPNSFSSSSGGGGASIFPPPLNQALGTKFGHVGGSGSATTPLSLNPDPLLILQQREAQIIQSIRQLHGKYQEIVHKQHQLCKMNVGPAPNPLLQELKLQDQQIAQQIEAHEQRLKQVRNQLAVLKMSVQQQSPMGPPPQPPLANPTHMSGLADELINPRGGVPRLPSHFPNTAGIPLRQQHTRPLMFAPDLTNQMSELKLSQQQQPLPSQMELRRQLAWESGVWGNVMGAGMPSSVFGSAGRLTDSPERGLGFDETSISTTTTATTLGSAPNPLGGDRRWAPDGGVGAYDWTLNGPDSLSAAVTTGGSRSGRSTPNCWLLISDLSPHISLDTLKMAISQTLSSTSASNDTQTSTTAAATAGGGGGGPLNPDFELHPNLASRYVLLGLAGSQEANAVANIITNNVINSGIKLGSADLITRAEAMGKLQEIKKLASQVSEDQSSSPPWMLSSPSGVADTNTRFLSSGSRAKQVAD
ncbi:hypothetical protein AAHC03_020603 [Spirometra sp. Aus1]